MNPALRRYLVDNSTPAPEALVDLAARTAGLGDAAGMMVPTEQAALLTLLVRLTGARRVVDVGTFTGGSALALALGLPGDGQLITCDVTRQWLPLAQEHWAAAGVADRIDFRLGPATRTLADLTSAPPVDLVFIDADKMNYPAYHRLAVPLLRPGGLLVADNVLLDGYVLAPGLAPEPLARRCAQVLRGFNAALAADDRLETMMLPIADGLTIARRVR
ncbi:class I SAM-dependent methyltransferase [Solwaraspora sp. WMMA2056]|uniref:O-methyltransferase n=1 Tax=Solwaraspora sp. WMMA2056 TaxID=3015161 RepID=UPI00338DCDBC